MPKRILFLISDTGGGHRSAANAIEEALHHLFPDHYQTIIADLWLDHTPFPINQIPKTYPWLTEGGLPLWKIMWTFSGSHSPHRFFYPLLRPFIHHRIATLFRDSAPDLIVSVHPMMNLIAADFNRRVGLNVPVVTTVTDLVRLHPTWICPDVDLCTVPSEPARQSALKFGMPPEKVVLTGQPVSLKFAKAIQERDMWRERLGLNPNRIAVLTVGGGEGANSLFDINRAIARKNPHIQLMIVAGRNKALRRRLEGVPWEVPTKVFGFVNNMPNLMAAADILVTKAGPGTISEAFIARLPLILSGYIPGQEADNVAYVQKHQAGIFANTPAQIAALIDRWTAPDSDQLRRMAHNSAAMAKPDAALNIARLLHDLI